MLEDEILAVRRRAGLFALAERGLLEITGSDAPRWLNGMITNDVARLEPGAEHSGCAALLLTNKGRLVSTLQVLRLAHGFWLELPGIAVADVLARLSKLVIADDVVLRDRSHEFERFGIEGPRMAQIMGAALGEPLQLAADGCIERELAGAKIVIARFGWSGEDAVQLFVAKEASTRVREALQAAAPDGTLAECSAETLEVLRVEAGRPRLGAELSLEVLPPEARLESAISYTKGCYTGQEIMARLRTRGHVNHLLVGLELEAGALPAPGTHLRGGGAEIGEITSAVRSPDQGNIALGFVRVGFAAPGTAVDVDGAPARVRELPFVTSAGERH